MKKKIVTTVSLLMLISLSGCGSEEREVVYGEDEFGIKFVNDTAGEFLAINYQYGIAGDPCGGGGVCHADNSMIKAGEELWKEFVSEDFSEDADLSEFWVQFTLLDNDQKEHVVENMVDINVVYGNTYCISLSGSAEDGYSAEYAEER